VLQKRKLSIDDDRPRFRVEAFSDLRPKISQSRKPTKIKLEEEEQRI